MTDHRRPDDSGETLLELLIALAIMGTAVVVLIAGLGTSVRMSDVHRQQAAAGAHVRAFAEAIETAVAASSSAYRDCAKPIVYAPLFSLTDPNYAVELVAVRYWDGSAAFVDACPAGGDTGVQQISLWDPLESTCRHASLSIL